MDKYYKNIQQLITDNLVYIKKQEISVNHHTLLTYHEIGRQLIEAQGGKEKAKYGNQLIKEYSIKLTNEYGKSYDYRSLFRMRQLYLSFPKVATLWRQLSWSIFRELLPIKNESKRNYYLNSVIEHNFSVRQLKEYIKSNAFERLIKKDNIKLKHIDNTNEDESDILDMIKNPILIAIDKSVDKITEKALKQFILDQIEKTMRELGIGFAYVGSEIPIKIGDKILKPDLVFFNIELNCYVILELKIKELTIKDIGQIEFYVKVYDRDIKKPHHNSTIGITISQRIDKDIINYNDKNNIKHTTYKIIDK
ncbi:MAG: PDDEXK nuclease domain-containing protein [Synergistaceae bacterium]|nr:PDDEXK nuclease domain-containing protein [Synergistaceae bacterium]